MRPPRALATERKTENHKKSGRMLFAVHNTVIKIIQVVKKKEKREVNIDFTTTVYSINTLYSEVTNRSTLNDIIIERVAYQSVPL